MSKYREKSKRSRFRKTRWRRVTQLMARDGQFCSLCDLALDRSIRNPRDPMYISFDHVLPRSKGGGDALSNQRLAHQQCNNERGSDPLVEELEAA